MKSTILISILILLIVSCTNKKQANEVTIKGKILSGHVDKVIFMFIDNPLDANGEQYITAVDSSSQFSISIPIERLAHGKIYTDRYYYEISFKPGDDLTIQMDVDTINFSGIGAEKNNFLYATERNSTHEGMFYSFSNKVDLNPTDFLVTLKKFKQKQLNFLETYPDKNLLEPDFVNYYKYNNEAIYDDLIRLYAEHYSYKSGIRSDSIQWPEEYAKMNQLSSFVNDSKIVSARYINNLSIFLFTKSEEVKNADSSLTFMDAIHTILFDSLTGKTQEYVLAKWICNNIYDTIAYNKFQEIEKDQLSEGTVKKALEKFTEKQSLIGKPLHHSFTETMLVDTSNTQLSFGEMMSKYKGKVVYLDIWSLNCGPCRGNMPYSKKLKERLVGLPIEFVYIAQDPLFKDVWEQIFNVSLTRDNQYRMVKSDWGTSEMLKFLEINWVPCYMIFDKEGNLIDFNADSPWVYEDGESRLEIQLKELANK